LVETAVGFREAPQGFLWMNPADWPGQLATLNEYRSSVLTKGHRQPVNLRSGFLECWSRFSQRAEAVSVFFRVPARRRSGNYVCPDAHQVIRPKPEAAGPAGSVAANLGIVDSKRDK
jgi:hypothetical protein